MAGHTDLDRPPGRGPSPSSDFARRPDGKVHFARVVVAQDDGRLVPRPLRRRAGLAPAVGHGHRPNALAVLPDGDGVDAGEPVDVIVLD